MVQLWNNHQSYTLFFREWSRHFKLVGRHKKQRTPSYQYLKKVLVRFNETGSIHPQLKGKVGASRRVRTPEKIAEVRESVLRRRNFDEKKNSIFFQCSSLSDVIYQF